MIIRHMFVLSKSVTINGLPVETIGPFTTIGAAQRWANRWEEANMPLPPARIDIILVPDNETDLTTNP